MKKISDDKMIEMLNYINQFSENSNIQNTIDDEVFKIMEEAEMTEEEQDEYWDFYQKIENLTFDKHNYIIDFKPFSRKEN